MSGFDYFKKVYANYVNFYGRARRKEYWYFMLFYNIFIILLTILDVLVFGMEGIAPFNNLFLLASILPSLAVGARRLHDIDKSGWWQLIALIPIIGAIVLIVFFVTDGNSGSNRFGDDPKLENNSNLFSKNLED